MLQIFEKIITYLHVPSNAKLQQQVVKEQKKQFLKVAWHF